jgi:hypothetical protein
MVFKMVCDGDAHILAASFWVVEICPLKGAIVKLLAGKGFDNGVKS